MQSFQDFLTKFWMVKKSKQIINGYWNKEKMLNIEFILENLMKLLFLSFNSYRINKYELI